jgi:hypothetical protein
MARLPKDCNAQCFCSVFCLPAPLVVLHICVFFCGISTAPKQMRGSRMSNHVSACVFVCVCVCVGVAHADIALQVRAEGIPRTLRI